MEGLGVNRRTLLARDATRFLVRELVWEAMTGTMRITAMVVFILIGSRVFSLVFQGVEGGKWIEHMLSSLPGGQIGFLVAVNVFIFAMGRLWSNAAPIVAGTTAVADPLEDLARELDRYPEYTVILNDYREEGNFFRSYYQQYKVVIGEGPEDDRTYREELREHPRLGWQILSCCVVGAVIGLLSAHLFRRHIRHRAHDRPRVRDLFPRRDVGTRRRVSLRF